MGIENEPKEFTACFKFLAYFIMNEHIIWPL